MKYITLIAGVGLAFSVNFAKAIVIVPPVVYIATFSIGTFILNAFVMTSVFMATKGLIDRFYLGKRMHEIVGILFSYIGSIAVIIAVSFISIGFFDPIDARTLFYASIFSAFLSFLIMALNNFRKYLLSDPYGRNELILRLISFAVVVFIITFVSAYFSMSTSILKKRDQSGAVATRDISEEAPLDLNFGLGFESAKKSADSIQREVASAPALVAEETIWFNPYMEGKCEIYVGGRLIKSEESIGKCFYYDSNNIAKRVICPVGLNIADLKGLALPKNRAVKLEGRRSCLDNYNVYVTDSGFKNIQ